MNDHVFVCYAREDKDFVLDLAEKLKHQGVSVWLDQWEIPPGANWSRTIEKALNECTHLLVVLSPPAVESDEVEAEWYEALDEKKVVVPILYQSCQMPVRLKRIQYIDFTSNCPDKKAALNDLLLALKGVPRQAESPTLKENLSAPSRNVTNEEAIKNYDEAIRRDPNDADSWYGKGWALSKLENYDDAIKAYDEAIRLNPNDADAWYYKGILFYKQSNHDEAIKTYDEAIRLNPNYANAWYEKSLSLIALGKDVESNAALAKAKALGYRSSD
jgi:tetratricopeptide (TPR) repeat protein